MFTLPVRRDVKLQTRTAYIYYIYPPNPPAGPEIQHCCAGRRLLLFYWFDSRVLLPFVRFLVYHVVVKPIIVFVACCPRSSSSLTAWSHDLRKTGTEGCLVGGVGQSQGTRQGVPHNSDHAVNPRKGSVAPGSGLSSRPI